MSRKDTGPAAGRELFAHLLAVDAVLAKAGFPPLSEFWRREAKRFLCSSARRWVVRVGRRGGKGITNAKLAVVFGLFAPLTLPPGEVALIPFLSTDRTEASARLRQIRAMLDALGAPYNPKSDEIELTGGRPVVFRVATASVRGVVGFSTIFAVCDEGARWRDENGANPAAEILGSLAPTMASQPEARLVFSSSPWSEADLHARMFEAGTDEHQVASFAETWVANPTITREATRALEPDERTWQREFAAQPSSSVASLVGAAEYDALVRQGGKRLPPEPGDQHVITVDVGLRHDSTVLSAWRKELREAPDGSARDVLVQCALECLRPGFLGITKVTPEKVIEAVAAMHRAYPGRVYADLHYFDAVGPALIERGIKAVEVPSTSSALTRRAESLMARFAAGGIELLEDERQRKEVLGAIVTHHAGGRITARAPDKRGAHDDHVSVLLLAVDPDVSGKLPYGGDGGLIVRYDPVSWSYESRELSGGRARYFKRMPNGVEMPAEPPYGSRAFEHFAREMLANGRSTRSIERWAKERYGLEHLPFGFDPDAFEEEQRAGLSVPIIHS